MSKKVYDVVATVGEYKTNDGTVKKRYLTCGAVFQGDKGMSIKLEALPVGKEWSGWLSLYEPKQSDYKPRQAAPPQPQSNQSSDEYDDIPF